MEMFYNFLSDPLHPPLFFKQDMSHDHKWTNKQGDCCKHVFVCAASQSCHNGKLNRLRSIISSCQRLHEVISCSSS